ncbi:fungal specific transcription factor factor [Fusarium napiforme]|uniref:Fungal specific transcription factor factor n=1 Tax=Fusarium napiforme TaxID=42672 RepID=A0A8H5JL95_9HYPO|nr:fungal specific transcription factor factor [Fusarium napiforme]
MEQSYSVQSPSDQSVPPHVIQFLQAFYAVSDTPGETDKYVDMFAEDATFVLASKKASGHAEITTLRQGMWEAVASRKHTLNKVYPFGAGSDEVMLHGSVALQLKNGGSAEIEWAGRAELEKTAADGKYRLKFYQVYLDTGAAAAYKK